MDAVKYDLDGVKTGRHNRAMAARQLIKRQKKRASAAGQKGATRPGAAAGPYHHGALHEALLKAAETVLERDGLTGLTLRAAAREAGVSHAAPTHHFGDMSGLLSELAASGFRKFGGSLAAAAADKASAKERLVAMGEAYVAFARNYPGMFLLMFRSERLDATRPGLREAMDQAFAVLTRSVSDRRGAASPPKAMIADVTRSWALVHGFAMLMLDHRLDHIVAHLPNGTDARDLLRAVLRG
jgi:AcrR family transcriptional regulator